MTREAIIKAIQQCAKKLGRNPTKRELRMMAHISEYEIRKNLGGLSQALKAAGLKPTGYGFILSESELLQDWASVARKVGRIPSVQEYCSLGSFSSGPFAMRYQRWPNITAAFLKFASIRKLRRAWKDVIEMAEAVMQKQSEKRQPIVRGSRRNSIALKNYTVYGRPILLPELSHEPVNECGVIFVFGMLARRLGFVVQHVQSTFPDCEAVMETARGRWQRVRIEFEFESRNFLRHGHKQDGCDMIVCWRHNWPECPQGLEVLELSKELGKVLKNVPDSALGTIVRTP